MPQANHPDRLVIERHPMQQMLRAALTAPAQGCHGVFGGAEAGHVSHAACTGEAETETVLEHSQPDSLGVFYSSRHDRQPAADIVRHIAAELRLTHLSRCILLALDTEGRMEALAYRFDGETFTSLTLEMSEDHALSAARENR